MADYNSQIADLQKQLQDSKDADRNEGNWMSSNSMALERQLSQVQAQQDAETAKNQTDADEDAQVAAAGQFVGYDKTGNAIYNNNGNYSSFDKNDFSRTLANLAKDPSNAGKSYENYAGEQQFKGLGDYQGIDKESGSAVFSNNGQLSGYNAKDFGNLTDYIKNQNMNKQWIDPAYEQQFNAAKQAGNSYQGTDAAGNQITKDALGHYQKVGAQDSGFSKFAQYNLADQKFAGPQGVTNAVQGENTTTAAPVAGQQRAVAANAESNTAQRMPFQNRGGSYSKFASANAPAQSGDQISQQTSTSSPAAPSAPAASPTPAKEQAVPQQAAPTSTAGMVLGGMTTAAKAASDSPKAPTALTNVFNQPSMFDLAKTAATNQAQSTATNAVQGQLTDANNAISDTSGISAQAITNPAAYARQMALQQASSTAKNQAAALGVDTGALGDTSKILSNPMNYAQQQAEAALVKQYGFDPSVVSNPLAYAQNLAGQQASEAVGFNPISALSNPMASAKQMAGQQASDAIGFDPIAAAKDPVGYAKQQAETEAKKEAAAQLAGNFAPGSGGTIAGGLNIGQNLLSNGVNANTTSDASKAAAKLALQTALTPVLGPLAGLVTPEMMQAVSGLTDKLGSNLGPAGTLLKPASMALNAGSGLFNGGLNVAGTAGSDMYNTTKQSLGGLKQISKGDILGGLTSIGKGLGNTVSNTIIKQPASIAKKVVSAVSNFFCFDGDTEILMENGKYKKIKNIKIGDTVDLGGTLIGIGEGYSQDLYNYNGVEVSGGHAVFENGVWKRVKTSDDAENLHIKKEVVVFPMATEHHLIVTKGQIWADLTETDDNYNKTEDERLRELNSRKRRNKLLQVYVKTKFI